MKCYWTINANGSQIWSLKILPPMSKRTKMPGGWSILRHNATKHGKRIPTIHRISLHIIIRADQLIQRDHIASHPRRKQLLQSLPLKRNLAKKCLLFCLPHFPLFEQRRHLQNVDSCPQTVHHIMTPWMKHTESKNLNTLTSSLGQHWVLQDHENTLKLFPSRHVCYVSSS